MIKLAILGVENSHSRLFASALAPKDKKGIFEDVELIGVYGDPCEEGYEIGVKHMEEVSSAPVFSDDYNRFLNEADAVMITARHGNNHLKYARAYLKKGIPVWIDKPFTCSIKEAEEAAATAEKSGSLLCSASSLEYCEDVLKFKAFAEENKENICGGHVSAPVDMNNPYGGFWFYSQHLVAMVITVFGPDIKSVKAIKDKNGVHAVYSYENFDVTAYYGGGYTVSIYNGNYDAVSGACLLADDYYIPELKAFYNVLKTKKADKTKKQVILPVYVLDATIRSYTENKEIFINI